MVKQRVNIIGMVTSETLALAEGTGGTWQFFVDDFANKVTYVKEIPLQ